MINKLTIIGVGLIGGSFGLAVRKKKLANEVVGVGRHIQKLRKAHACGAVDRYTTSLILGVKDADLIMIATPVTTIPVILKKILPHLKQNAIITDVGSTKTWVVKEAEKIIQAGRPERRISFIGGHPMAGSEKEGVENARENMFSGCTCILTPRRKDSPAVRIVAGLWKSIGAKTLYLTPEEHDCLVAYTSHLPHVLATTLVNLLGKLNKEKNKVKRILAGSIRDMTRIAASNSEVWTDICISNSYSISQAIEKMVDCLNQFRKLLENGNRGQIRDEFRKGKCFRQGLMGNGR